MTFITVKNTKKTEISIFDILEGKFDNNEVIEQNDESYTRTFKVETIKEAVKEKANINYILLTLKLFNKKYEHLKNQNREDLYNEFFIPKHSGGIRTIDEPKEELKSALNELKDIFENKFRVLPHTSAHAYIKIDVQSQL